MFTCNFLGWDSEKSKVSVRVRLRARVRVGVRAVVGHLLLVDVLDEHVEGLRVAVHLGRD